MIIATFGPSTGWAGKTIIYEAGRFALEGHGNLSTSDVMAYDAQGHLEWAYDGLREWVSESAAGQAAPAPPVAAARKHSIFWPVLGALVVFFVVIPVVGFIGCAACGTAAVENAAMTTAAAPTPAAKPASTAAPTGPERHYFGQSQIIRDGSEALQTTPLSLSVSQHPPASVAPMQWGKGWVYAVVRVRFENVGSKFTKSLVGMWSTLACKDNAESDVAAEWGDTQGNMGTLELDPGQSAIWQVTFTIRKVAHPISFSYQGPGGHTDTWYLK